MKASAVAAAMAISFIMLAGAAGAADTARPPGVGAKEWIAISDSLGIVVILTKTPVVPQAGGQPLLLTPPLEGFFMVKQNGSWRRFEIVESSGVVVGE